MRWDAERFRMDTGVLGLSAVALPPGEARRRREALATTVLRGRDRSEFWRDWQSPDWTQHIDGDGPVPIALDGETLEVPAPLTFHVRPRALRLLVPADVPDTRPRDAPVASRQSAAFAWHALHRWIRVTRSGSRGDPTS
jgi:hypothetical protein